MVPAVYYAHLAAKRAQIFRKSKSFKHQAYTYIKSIDRVESEVSMVPAVYYAHLAAKRAEIFRTSPYSLPLLLIHKITPSH
jgi:hypothetical protein